MNEENQGVTRSSAGRSAALRAEPASAVSGLRPAASNAAHTPGPWLMAAKPSSVVGWPIVAPQALGRVICSLNYADPKAFAGRMPGDGKFNAESRANGLLIAAAPDLYDALVDFMERPEFHVAVGGNPQAVDAMFGRARAALAKARGA